MSRSVTRAAVGVTIPLLTVTLVAVVGLQPRSASRQAPTTSQKTVAFLGPGRAALNHLERLEGSAEGTPMASASAAVPGGQPRNAGYALQAVRPAARPAPRPRSRAIAVGGAALEFSLVNQDRAANGVAGLAWSSALARVAQYRAQDMLNRNYFSHYDPSTGQLAFVELLHLWGIPYTTAGENIAWSTNPSMVGINTMFMNSAGHRANILNGAYHRVGIGVASAGGKTMVVEVFSN